MDEKLLDVQIEQEEDANIYTLVEVKRAPEEDQDPEMFDTYVYVEGGAQISDVELLEYEIKTDTKGNIFRLLVVKDKQGNIYRHVTECLVDEVDYEVVKTDGDERLFILWG